MNFLLALLALASPALGIEASRQQTRLDLGSICLSPLFGSDAAHTSLCSGEGLLPRYRPSKARKSKTWDQIGPCYRESNATTEYCVYHNARFAHNRGISIFTDAARARHIAKSLGFASDGNLAQDINVPSRKWKVVPVPGKEYGVVAAETIFKGQNVLSETASLMIDYSVVENVPHMDILRMQAVGVDYLPTGHRERFLNMSTHGAMLDHVHKVEKIFVTNAFDVEMDDEAEEQMYAIFAETARMNHDCRPNVDYFFDAKTLTQHATAIRNIYPGEELTLSYINPLRTRQSRLTRLHTQWGFHCSCPLCQSSTHIADASDARILQIQDLRKEFTDWSASSRATPQMAELLISLYDQERIHSMLGEAYTHAAIEYNGVGDPWSATRYAHLAVEAGLAVMREDDADVAEMRRLTEDPWGHWSWMLREKKRMGWGRKAGDEDEE